MKTIGLIGGMSWESTATYYKLLNEGVRMRLGGLHSAPIVLWSVDFAPIAAMQTKGNWEAAADVLVSAANSLQLAGAQCILLATNTMHKVSGRIVETVDVPFLNIMDVTASAIKALGSQKPLLLATRFTMEDGFYRDYMKQEHALDIVVPDEAERGEVHRIIYQELCTGRIEQTSKQFYKDVICKAKDNGCDAVIFGCTEIGLLVSQQDVLLPVLDTTALHATAALDYCFADEI